MPAQPDTTAQPSSSQAQPPSSQAQPSSQAAPQEWQLLAVLAAVQFTHILDFMVMMPLGPQFMRIFDITPGQFGLLVSSYTLAAAASGVFAAFRFDRYDRKKTLLLLYGCFLVATTLCSIAPSYQALLWARCLAGAFGGVLHAMVHAIIGDAIAPQRRGRATGTVAMGFSMSAVAGVPIGLALANQFGWRAPFLAVALASGLVWLCAWRILPSLRGHVGARINAREKLRLVFGERNHRYALLLAGCLMLAGFSVIPFISPYLVANAGLAETDLPYVYFAGGLATLITSRAIGWCADRYGKRRMFALVASASTLAILIVTNLGRVGTAWIIAATTLFFILVSGRFVPAMALINASALPQHRGSLTSFTAALQSACSACAAIGAGHVIQRSTTGTLLHYQGVGVFAVIMTLCAVFWSRKLRLLGDR